MKQELNLPAAYAVLSEDEMTYTEGGSLSSIGTAAGTVVDVLKGVATVVGVLVLGSSYIWGISQGREWLSYKSNTEGNFFTVMGRAIDDIGTDMTRSPANFLRDAVSTTMVVALAPVSAVLMLV